MSVCFRLGQERVIRLKHMFPKTRGVARSDDHTVLSRISRNGRQRRVDLPDMSRTRRSTIGLSGAHALLSLRASFENLFVCLKGWRRFATLMIPALNRFFWQFSSGGLTQCLPS